MRRLSLRSLFAFALAFTAACADDIPEVVTGESSSGSGSSSGPGPVSLDSSSGADTTVGPPDTTDTGSSSGSSSGGPVCGDDQAEGDEPCDGTDLGGNDCLSLGYDGGRLGCMADCSDFDTSSCTTAACGDDMIGGREVCDGTDLGGSDCLSEGFDGGTLACMADCTALDTSACTVITCGDDMIDGTDVCDGVDLGGNDCVSIGMGFDDGTLACMADCTAFDTSGCIMFTCGNDVLEGAETCDGLGLGGNDCISQGFDGGTLACMGDCSAFDTSGCYDCGDGVVGGPEVCDGADLLGSDCASIGMGFDGGSLACAADCAAFDTNACTTCGDGIAEGTEACDGADLAGSDCVSEGFDGGSLACNAACGFDTAACHLCGDGVIGGPEECDGANLNGQTCQLQGFDFGNLGCTLACGYTQLHCVDITSETEPNDDGMVAVATNDFFAPAANGPYTSDALIAAAINPAGDDDVFAVSNPGPGYAFLSLETYGPIPGACPAPTDTVIYVLTSTGLQLATNDQSGIDSCSLLTNLLLPPGVTIYVRVTDYLDDTVIPAYHLHIRMNPVVCGDTVAGPGEQCDDGGTADGDGCSATCVAEGATQEIEPNNTSPEADATGIVATGNALFGGVIGALGDVDRYRLDLAAPQVARFETFSAVGVCTGIATTLRIFDAAGVQLAVDGTTGISNCSAITFPLAAGTYYVQVEENGNDNVIPTYLLEIAVQGDNGIETEPNEDQASANANLAGGVSNVYVFGDHAVNVDSDYYAIDVPVSGSSLRLEVIEGDRAVETCESLGVDSRVTLYDAAGVQLANDDDESRGYCSLIDGTGLVPLDAGAHDLAAGTYYVQVRASTLSQMGAAGQFIYRLVATVRAP